MSICKILVPSKFPAVQHAVRVHTAHCTVESTTLVDCVQLNFLDKSDGYTCPNNLLFTELISDKRNYWKVKFVISRTRDKWNLLCFSPRLRFQYHPDSIIHVTCTVLAFWQVCVLYTYICTHMHTIYTIRTYVGIYVVFTICSYSQSHYTSCNQAYPLTLCYMPVHVECWVAVSLL